MAYELVTGLWEQPHVTAEQDALLNATLISSLEPKIIVMPENVGTGLSEGKFDCSITGANQVKVEPGAMIATGRLIISTVAVNISLDPGISGSKRADIIAMHYEKNQSTGIETIRLEAFTGTSGADYVDPDVTESRKISDITENNFPLFRVKFNGTAITTIERICDYWYGDTGWLDNVLTPNFSPLSGAPSFSNIRVVGSKAHLEGITYVPSDFTDGFMQKTYTLSNYFPKKAITKNLGLFPAQGGVFYTTDLSVGTDGTIYVSSRIVTGDSAPAYVMHNFEGVSWFLD